jgi:hypothetical protein
MPSEDNMVEAPPEFRMVTGQAYSVEDLLFRMIAWSDNHARDLLTNGVTEGEILGIMASMNAEEIPVGGHRYVTPRGYSTYFRALYNATVLSRSYSEFALGLLSEGYNFDGMRKYFPTETVVASKFGIRSRFTPENTMDGQFHECGIVYHPRGPFLLCVMTKSELESGEELADVVADLSRIVWETMSE